MLQLADSAFPSGGFAHSGGVEALKQLGVVHSEPSLLACLRELAWHTGHSALPFVTEAHRFDPCAADEAAEVFLVNDVARRASRAQGGAFLIAAHATFEVQGVTSLKRALPHGHVAVAFGAVFRALERSVDEARQLFLFSSVRGALSAAVRLGVVGPLRAQAVLWSLHPLLDDVLVDTASIRAHEAAGTSVWFETAQMGHDRLYSRLFQS